MGPVKPAPAATSVPRCSPEKYSTYYDQRGSTLRVSPGEPGLTGAEKKQARQLIVFPVFCRQLNLQELTAQVDMEESSVTLALDGLARSRQLPARQAVKEFEALLLGSPLRVIYWQQKTEPDGTLHGALFFKTGEPVEQEMIRRGLAEADAGQAAP